MIIGLVLLAIVAVLIFFGLTTRFFKRIGVANWLAFLLVLALVVGAVLPNIRIGTMFSMNIGGFLLPLSVTVFLMIMLGANSNLAKSVLALLAVASVAISTRMLMMPTSMGMQIGASIIVGIVGGAVAYLIAKSRLGTLAAAMGGIVLGDIVVSLVYRFVTETTGNVLMLGVNGVFDSLIIASVFGVLLAEVIGFARRMASDRRISAGVVQTESAEDNLFEGYTIAPSEDEDGFDDYFNDDID